MNNKAKYFLYARKSTESDERQIQSLADQINIMRSKAKILWIEIIDIFQESMSAKAPWRYMFNEMIQRIHNWEAEGIIAWKLDRLSRNPIDSWNIQYMLQTGALEKVITNDKEYNSNDAWLLMSVENWMSNQFIIDLKKNVKRWMDSKTEKWIFCWQAPEWYLNIKDNKTIIVDEQNFPLIKKAWDLILTWTYSVPQVLKILNNKWGYSSNKKWKNEISMAWLYAIFKNPFYTGDFLRKWEIKKWTHKAMITWEEYDRVQQLIGKKGNTIRWKTREFAFTWTMKCWECGCSIVAEEKNKYVKATWTMKKYIYYRCSKRKKWCTCKQKPINLNKLEEQINDILKNIEILPEFKTWGLDILKRDFKNISIEREHIITQLKKDIKKLSSSSEKLLDYLIDETITREDYNDRKEVIKKDFESKTRQLEKLENDKDNSIEFTENLFDLIVNITNKFNNWSLKDKKLIFSFLGRNLNLKDGVLALELHSWLIPLFQNNQIIKRKYKGLEPTKKGISKVKTDDLSQVIWLWSSVVQKVRTEFIHFNWYVNIPLLKNWI